MPVIIKPYSSFLFTVCAFVLLSLTISSCSFKHQAMIDPTIRSAEQLQAIATEKSLKDSTASMVLKEAQKANSEKEYEEAWHKADKAVLLWRLTLAKAALDSAKLADSLQRSSLDREVQEKSAYEYLLSDIKAKRGVQ